MRNQNDNFQSPEGGKRIETYITYINSKRRGGMSETMLNGNKNSGDNKGLAIAMQQHLKYLEFLAMQNIQHTFFYLYIFTMYFFGKFTKKD